MKQTKGVLALSLLAIGSFNSFASGSVTDVFVVGSDPLNQFSEGMTKLIQSVACSMGYQPKEGTCEESAQYSYDPFKNGAFLSSAIFVQNMATPFSLGYSSLYRVSSDTSDSFDSINMEDAPPFYLDYNDPNSDLASYTNYIFTNNSSDSDWWYNGCDMGYYSSSECIPSYTTTDTDTSADYAVDSSNQEQYLSNPTAVALLNAIMMPYVCLNSSDVNCMSDVVFPLVQKAVVNEVIDLSGNTTMTSDQLQVATVSDLQTALPQAYTHLQSLPALNIDTLLTPIMYKTEVSTSPESTDDESYSLEAYAASNELEAATSFVKYVTGQFLSITPLLSSDFSSASIQTIYTYMAQMRQYTSQMSVPISNLNWLLAKRVAPTISANSATGGTSSSLSQSAYEYNMSTRRLQTIKCDSSSSGSSSSGSSSSSSAVSCDSSQTPISWIEKVRAMSPNQREAENLQLLAEINYQLYLNRQVLERMLATESTGLAGSIGMMKQNLTLDNASTQGLLLTTGSGDTSSSSSSSSS